MECAHGAGHDPRVQADPDHHGDRGTREHRVRDRGRARDRAQDVSRQEPAERVHRPAARALSRRRRAFPLPPVRSERLVRKLVRQARHPDPVRAAGDGHRDDLRLDPVRRARGRSDAPGDRRRAGAGGANARRERLADVLADHAAVDPLGRDLRGDPHDCTLPGRVRRRRGRVGTPPGADGDGDPCASRRAGRASTSRGPTRSRSSSRFSRYSFSSR